MTDYEPTDGLTDSQEDELLKSLGKIVANSYPNPDRVGCPSEEVLRAIASRTIDTVEGADHIRHVLTCSPCYRRIQALRRRAKSRRSIGGAAVAILALLGGSMWFIRHNPQQPAAYTATFDLRKAPVMRRSGNSAGVIGELPRGRVTLSVILPVGSQEGTYYFALMHDGRPVVGPVSAPGRRNHGVDAAEVTLDTSGLAQGIYRLAVRHEAVDWTTYVIRIR